jgi:hypothetical protein
LFELGDFGRWLVFLILIERRDAIQFEDVDARAFGREFLCCSQQGAVV